MGPCNSYIQSQVQNIVNGVVDQIVNQITGQMSDVMQKAITKALQDKIEGNDQNQNPQEQDYEQNGDQNDKIVIQVCQTCPNCPKNRDSIQSQKVRKSYQPLKKIQVKQNNFMKQIQQEHSRAQFIKKTQSKVVSSKMTQTIKTQKQKQSIAKK